MASKFFAEGEHQSESEDEQNSSSDEQKPEVKTAKRPLYFESSSDEEEKRTIKSEKDKRFDALNENIRKIKEKMRIEDFAAISDEFDELNKNLDKSKKVIEKHGIPLFYTRILYVLDNFVNNFTAEKKKALKPANSKGFNALKMKLRKNNKNFVTQLEEFAKNPVFSEDEGKKDGNKKKADDDSDESSSDDSEVDKKKKKTVAKDSDSESSSGLSDSSGEASVSSSDDDEDDARRYLQSSDPQVRRNYWLLREDTKNDADEEEEEQKRISKKIEQQKRAEQLRLKALEAKYNQVGPAKEKVAHTVESMDRKIREIIEKRSGKKGALAREKRGGVDEDLENLQEFLNDSKDNSRRLEILLILLPTRADYSKTLNSSHMLRYLWVESFKNIQELFRLIKTKDRVKLGEIRNFQKDADPHYKESAIVESFSTYFNGLDDDLYKGFKSLDNNDPEYHDRLRDQANMYKLARDALEYFDFIKDENNAAKFAFKAIEYSYSISDSVLERMRVIAREKKIDFKNELYGEANTEKLIQDLSKIVYRSSEEKLKVKTLLYQIYHHSINGRYHAAKDYLLMSHIPDFIQNTDLHMQTVYNRAIIQLGLCAFRNGLLSESHQALADICSTGRIRELLSQNISRNSLNEKEERRRLLPYHLHINIEMIEAIFLIGSMLIEVPYIASDPFDGKFRNISRSFRKLYDQFKNMYGPAESYRDHVIVAGRELLRGNWKVSYEQLIKIKIWEKLPCDIEKTKENLLEKVKEQAFKCYLFSYQSCYDSLDLDKLAQQFELTKETVQAAICKLVCSRELRAFLDIDNNCLVFQRDENTKLENLAMQLSDRITTMLVNNEKIMDTHSGNYGYSDKNLTDNASKNGKKPYNNKKRPNILKKKTRGTKRN